METDVYWYAVDDVTIRLSIVQLVEVIVVVVVVVVNSHGSGVRSDGLVHEQP